MQGTSSSNMQNSISTGTENPRQVPSSVADFSSHLIKDTAQSIGQIGANVMEQFMNAGKKQEQKRSPEFPAAPKMEHSRHQASKERITIFSFREQKERKEIQQIKELIQQIKEELKAIKLADAALSEQIKDAEKLALESNPDASTYNLHFLEIVLKLLHVTRMKIGESSAWLQAMTSKRGKRGSAFGSRKAKLGSQYSDSNELKNTRAVK